MNSLILCEGSTDYFLLQYYMRKAYHWEDDKEQQNRTFKLEKQKSRKLEKRGNFLTIAAVGGCSRLTNGLEQALQRNRLSAPDSSENFQSIVMVTDRDEIETEQEFFYKVRKVFEENEVDFQMDMKNNQWTACSMVCSTGERINYRFLLLVIPFEENGAMETFLLNAISNEDEYDREMIEACSQFVDGADREKRYLTGRRKITKAKFDTYFSIRTSAEQFAERQNILKGVPWEQYTLIQSDFKMLEELG